MVDRLLHALHIPADAFDDVSSRARQRMAKQGALSSGPGSARGISSEPGERTLIGYYAGKFAELQAEQLEELFDANADGIEAVPFTTRQESTGREDGYYVLENVESRRTAPNEPDFAQFDGRLTRKGRRKTHWRGIKTAVSTETNPFGAKSRPKFGLDKRAQKVRWFNSTDGTLEPATAINQIGAEHRPIDIYDPSDPSITDPTLLYTIPYRQEWETDVRVWDTYNRPKEYTETSSKTSAQVGSSQVGSATVGESPVDLTVDSQWQRVYVTEHEWRGNTIIENDVLRLEVPQPERRLLAYRWDDPKEIYAPVTLPKSADSWSLYDLNIKYIGLTRIEAQLEFESDGGNRKNVDMHLYRGRKNADLFQTDNGDAIPSTLQTHLDPIASATADLPVATSTLIAREEVDR